jgi:hypothetical protein
MADISPLDACWHKGPKLLKKRGADMKRGITENRGDVNGDAAELLCVFILYTKWAKVQRRIREE